MFDEISLCASGRKSPVFVDSEKIEGGGFVNRLKCALPLSHKRY